MKIRVLSETIVATGNIPNVCNIDHQHIAETIFSKRKFFVETSDNLYNDIHLDFNTQINKINKYIIERFKVDYDIDLIEMPSKAIYSKTGENTYLRNHLNKHDIHNAADYVCIYMLSGNETMNDKMGKMIIHYSDHRDPDKQFIIPYEQNAYVIINSDTNYYFTPNGAPYDRILVITEFQKG
jgi:hypothetical protein